MRRFLFLLCGLFLANPVWVDAETFRCRTPDGRQIFSDDPARFPPDCQMITEVTIPDDMNILPAYQPPPVEPPPAQTSPVASGGADDSLFAGWQARAETLVSDYEDAQRQRYHEVIQQKQLAAIRKLNKIRSEKLSMLEKLDGSPLDSDQREQIRQILEGIPDS